MAAHPAVSLASIASFDGTHLGYNAAGGEVNTVTVSYAARVFTLTDTTASITAAIGCSSVTAHKVTCDGHNNFSESVFGFTIDTGASQHGKDRTFTTKASGGHRLAKCVVPKVVGKPLANAKKAIVAAHCAVGNVSKKHSSKKKKGRVLAQSPKPGKKLANGARVKLTVGTGP
jgi:hypothetical protein